MSTLLSKYKAPDKMGCTQKITPENAGWEYVGFEVYELKTGQKLVLPASSNELCLVLVAGKASIRAETASFENIGERMNPFERKKPYAVYVSAQEGCEVEALTPLELAVCKAPGK
ncbi:5-deoxy-glucuronate isomerase, partial [Vibrio anguillarum]